MHISSTGPPPHKYKQRDVHNNNNAPNHNRRRRRDPMIPHLHSTGRIALRIRIPLRLRSLRPAHRNLHILAAASKPDERGAGEGQDDTKRDLAALERAAEALAPDGARDDDAGRDADAAGDEAAHPRLDGPVELALGDHLAGDGADDAGRGAGEEQGEGEDGAGDGREGRGEQVVNGEEVGVVSTGDGGQGGASNNEDRAVNEEREGHEGDG